MFGSFIPREGKFFDLFDELAATLVEGAHTFLEMLANPSQYENYFRKVKDIEHKADDITHASFDLLHKTFITPMDREDIRALVSGLDDIMDCMDATAARLFLYDVGQVPQEAIELAQINVKSVEKLAGVVSLLKNIKNPEAIIKNCIELHGLENDGDHVLRTSMAKLFKNEQDIRRLIKLKEVFELLELVTDKCEDVANTIEGIVLEYA